MKTDKITLYFKQGQSDKLYNVSLEAVDDNSFVVNFAYGRRGATLKTGIKTKKPVVYEKAKKIYDKLVKSKLLKGYKPGEAGSTYTHTSDDTRDTGIHCQLLNVIEEPDIAQLIADPAWWAQEKHDGKRMLLHKTGTVTAINRTGFSVGAPDVILNQATQIEQSYLVDGEAVGETLFVFDCLEFNQTDIRAKPYHQRLLHVERLGFHGSIVVVKTARTPTEKQQLYTRLKTDGAEGIVFKQQAAPYTVGRPNSGGTQLKFKFYATASVIVTHINDKRSVALAVIDNHHQTDVGNVTIPPNQEIPPVGSIIEVRYLYAYKGGSLYQPTYLALRDDIKPQDCHISQLKYKQNPA